MIIVVGDSVSEATNRWADESAALWTYFYQEELPKMSDYDRQQAVRVDDNNAIFNRWIDANGAKAVLERKWIVTGFDESGHETSDVVLTDPEAKFPLRDITTMLNVLGADGWSVVSYAEDKGVYSGDDAKDVSHPTAVRLILGRES
jgi:hypothetical protein